MGAGHCQWGEFTDRNVCNIIWSVGLLAAAGEVVTHGRTESQTIIMDDIRSPECIERQKYILDNIHDS